jgi:hypothetical protein
MHKLTKPMLLSASLSGVRVDRPGTVEFEPDGFGQGCTIKYSFDVADRILGLSATFVDEPAALRRIRSVLTTALCRELHRRADWIWEGHGVSAAIWGGVEPGEPLTLSVSYWEPDELSASAVPQQ